MFVWCVCAANLRGVLQLRRECRDVRNAERIAVCADRIKKRVVIVLHVKHHHEFHGGLNSSPQRGALRVESAPVFSLQWPCVRVRRSRLIRVR